MADLYNVSGTKLAKTYNLSGNEISVAYKLDGNEAWRNTVQKYGTFSVLGDSYSSYKGYVQPSTNRVYYPKSMTDADKVDSYTQMWWYRFSQEYGISPDMINGYSGSSVANDTAWTYGVEECFIARSDNLGSPDMIIIFGGTNDAWKTRIQLGSPKYSGWTDADKEKFAPAAAYLISHIKSVYPKAQIIWICNTHATSSVSGGTGNDYYQALHTVCDHYKVPVVDVNPDVLYYTDSDRTNNQGHPSKTGQKQISDALIKYLGKNEISRNEVSI